MAKELAEAEGVCARPQLRRVVDRETGTVTRVALACGSTREAVCPACAGKARRLRMQQCAEGWHRTDEPERETGDDTHSEVEDDEGDELGTDFGSMTRDRRVRSTRRRQDVPDLPHLPVSSRTVGVVFSGNNGREYRPSMFLTLTLPSYGQILDGAPADPASYNYRRAALDAMLFPRLLDQFWKTLRRAAGYDVQYFSAVEPQRRLAPHLHAAIRGAIPRRVLRQVAAATYLQVWWPAFDQAGLHRRIAGVDRRWLCRPCDWSAVAHLGRGVGRHRRGLGSRPAHVMRFGSQLDVQGLVRGQPEADRAIRYLTKYITKDVAGSHGDDQDERHRRMWIGCTASSVICRARSGAPTGCGTAFNPSRPALGWCPASVAGRRIVVSILAWVVDGCWCPVSGRRRLWPGIAPIGLRWCGPLWSRPGIIAPETERMSAGVQLLMVAPVLCGSRSIGTVSAMPR